MHTIQYYSEVHLSLRKITIIKWQDTETGKIILDQHRETGKIICYSEVHLSLRKIKRIKWQDRETGKILMT